MLKFSNAERILKFLHALQINEKVLKAEIVSLKRQIKYMKQNCYCPEHFPEPLPPPASIRNTLIHISKEKQNITS